MLVGTAWTSPSMLLSAVCLFSLAGFPFVEGRRAPIMESRLENFYQCPGSKNTTVVIKDARVKRISSSESRLYGKMIFQEDLADMWGRVEMLKCASKSEPDTCEYYTTIKYNAICSYLEEKKEPWFGYFNDTTVPKKCPFKKGDWDMLGVKIGLTKSFPLFTGFWRFRNKGFDLKNHLVACFIMEMNVISRFKI